MIKFITRGTTDCKLLFKGAHGVDITDSFSFIKNSVCFKKRSPEILYSQPKEKEKISKLIQRML